MEYWNVGMMEDWKNEKKDGILEEWKNGRMERQKEGE
jgi:hypothetical protein